MVFFFNPNFILAFILIIHTRYFCFFFYVKSTQLLMLVSLYDFAFWLFKVESFLNSPPTVIRASLPDEFKNVKT